MTVSTKSKNGKHAFTGGSRAHDGIYNNQSMLSRSLLCSLCICEDGKKCDKMKAESLYEKMMQVSVIASLISCIYKFSFTHTK